MAGGDFAYVRALEPCRREIRLKRLMGVRIKVQTKDDIHPGIAEPATGTATPGEKVEHLDLHDRTLPILRPSRNCEIPAATRSVSFV
jgi:hypothetical protein